jgi:hypothetical protein
MINILRIHKLNTTEFLFFSKQHSMIVFADRLFKSVSNHGNLKNILQNVISNLLVYD